MTPQRRRLAIVGVLAVVAVAIAFFVGRGDDEGDDLATDTTSTTSSTTEATTSSTTTTDSTTSTTDGSSETTETTAATSSTTEAPPSTSPSGDGPPRAPSGSAFANAVTAQFENRGLDAAQACNVANPGVRRVLTDYGAVYVARGVTAPTACIFAGPSATNAFQGSVDAASATIGGVQVTLQRPALEALQAAVAEANGGISPRGDSSAAARSFETSHQYWLSRVNPGLDRYVSEGRISSSYAEQIRAMDNLDQVAAILDLESQGMLFGLNQNGSIMSSVAPPGSSQHHSMLGFDVAEFANPSVRSILASHGWFQTVISDEPHFTYLGASESELPSLGLRSVSEGGYTYWIPDV